MDTPKQIEYSIGRFNLFSSLLTFLNRNDEGSPECILSMYMLEHLHELGHLSIYKIAEDCYLSRSSVQRFIRTLGYDSFTSLKASLPETERHQQAFIDYADHTDYSAFLACELNAMAADINETCVERNLAPFAHRIHDAHEVVILTAEDSSSAARTFQQAMLSTGKLIRLITSSATSLSPLARLTEGALLIVCSTTGNYAIAIDKEMHDIKAKKCLVTINRTTLFEKTYGHIYYLSTIRQASHREISRQRDIYTRYAMQYFFDLLFNQYLRLFG